MKELLPIYRNAAPSQRFKQRSHVISCWSSTTTVQALILDLRSCRQTWQSWHRIAVAAVNVMVERGSAQYRSIPRFVIPQPWSWSCLIQNLDLCMAVSSETETWFQFWPWCNSGHAAVSTIWSIKRPILTTDSLGTTSLPHITEVQNGCTARLRFRLISPPGGENDQHLTATKGDASSVVYIARYRHCSVCRSKSQGILQELCMYAHDERRAKPVGIKHI